MLEHKNGKLEFDLFSIFTSPLEELSDDQLKANIEKLVFFRKATKTKAEKNPLNIIVDNINVEMAIKILQKHNDSKITSTE